MDVMRSVLSCARTGEETIRRLPSKINPIVRSLVISLIVLYFLLGVCREDTKTMPELFVHESFNGLFGCFLEGFVFEFDVGNLGVAGYEFVEFLHVLLHQFAQILDAQAA